MIFTNEVKQVSERFHQQVFNELLKVYDERVKAHSRFIKSFENRFIKFSAGMMEELTPENCLSLQRTFKKSLLELAAKRKEEWNGELFIGFVLEIGNHTEAITNGLPETLNIKTKLERYEYRKEDDVRLFLRKKLNNVGFDANLRFKKSLNRMRKIAGRSETPLEVFKLRKVPFRQMVHHFVANELALIALNHQNDLMKAVNEGLLKIWEFDGMIDNQIHKILTQEETPKEDLAKIADGFGSFIEELKTDNRNLLDVCSQYSEEAISKTLELFEKALADVDSFDMPAKRFSPRVIHKKNLEVKRQVENRIDQWKNAQFSLLDDWLLDLEISHLYYSVFDEYNRARDRIEKYIAEELETLLVQISNFIGESISRLNSSGETPRLARETITLERKKINTDLIDSLLTKGVEKFTGRFSDDFEKLSSLTQQFVAKVSDKRCFVSKKEYLRPVRKSELNWVSPQEMLNYEAFPHYKESMERLSARVESLLEDARLNLLSVGDVCDFSLESGLIMLEQKKGAPRKTLSTVTEGMERALTHNQKVREALADIELILKKDLKNAINLFHNEINKLKATDKLLDLNLKIARIKTIEKSRQVRKRSAAYVRHMIPQALEWVKTQIVGARFSANKIGKRMGFVQERTQLSYEISEFLSNTEAALAKLPFVYQRLYQLHPTDEERFFVNRQAEIAQLAEAFENWEKDRFANVTLIGEKGSGVTSVINYFFKSKSVDIPILRYNLNQKVFTPESYFNLFNKILDSKGFESNQQIIDHLNGLPGTRVVVIENLHHMFIKKVGGFECLHMFFDLMANTLKKVLWIGAFTPPTWNYLNKTIGIAGFFTNEILLERMSKDTIEQIIFKRNRLSGYHIHFNADEKALAVKTFQKMGEERRQEYLRNYFFGGLRRISGGNISIAQLYWLRSTMNVSGQTISINMLKDIDFSFIKNLSDDYLFVLQIIIQHDGLTLEDFALAANKTLNSSRILLTPMLEKGFLIRPASKFNVHPLIFNALHEHLVSRNFIN